MEIIDNHLTHRENFNYITVTCTTPCRYIYPESEDSAESAALKSHILSDVSLVSTDNFSLTKIICHRNFGNEFALKSCL